MPENDRLVLADSAAWLRLNDVRYPSFYPLILLSPSSQGVFFNASISTHYASLSEKANTRCACG